MTTLENLPSNVLQQRPTREDGSLAEDTHHTDQLNKLNKDHVHTRHHYDAKIQRKSQQARADLNMDKEMPDRVETLRDENTHLRQHYNSLEDQVKVIQSKLRRQIQQLKSDRIVGGGKTSDTAQFEASLERLLEEDVKLQEEERLLMAKCRKMQQQRREQLAQGKNLYSVAEEHQIRRQSKVETEQLQIIQTLKVQIDQGNKRIIKLKEQISHTSLQKDHTTTTDELQAEKRQTEVRLMHARSKLEDIRAQNKVKQDIYKDNKGYEQQLMATLSTAQNEYTKLQQQHRTMEYESAQNKEMRERLLQVRCDRDRLQNDFDALMRQPFFKQASSQSNLKQLEGLQNTIEAKDREILELRNKIDASDRDITKIAADTKQVKAEKANTEEQLNKITKHMDPFELTLDDVMARLKVADPIRFREVMDDLKFSGSDPSWYQMYYTDHVSQLTSTNPTNLNDVKPALKFRDQLVTEKAKLASELQRIQNLLKLQVDIDKQNSALMQAELNTIKANLKANAFKTTELDLLIKGRNDRIITMQQAIGPQGLSKQDLDKFNTQLNQLKKEANMGVAQDQLSEFSIITDESEMEAKENRLDLRVSTASFERVAVVQLLGGQELTPSQLRTFLTVDFYNHDSKHTDQSESFEPIYNTLFSFKNHIDDFYLGHLEKDSILIDVFAVPPPTVDRQRAQGAIKIGQARLPLIKLIEGDFSFQAQEIMHETATGHKIKVGKLFFRMRMRKPLDQALKWYNQAKLLKGAEKEVKVLSAVQSIGNKIIEIAILQANNLQISGLGSAYSARRMLPFFSYEFYTFEWRSPTAQGNCPTFDSVKSFEVEASPQFLNYMKTQILQIHLIDESVDMTSPNSRDYIGTVRIPLRDVILKQKIHATFQVLDENRKVCGDLAVKIVMHDAPSAGYLSGLTDSQTFSQSTKVTHDVLARLVTFLANQTFDLEMCLDMLFAKDLTQSGRVSKQQITDFFIKDLKIGSLIERDIDIMLRTHQTLGPLEFVTRSDLVMLLEKPYQEAKEKALYLQENQQMYTGYGSKQQQQLMRDSGAFDQKPQKPVENPFASSKKPTLEKQPSAQFTSTISLESLEKNIKNQLYEILNNFQLECGVNFPGATKAQSVKVLKEHGTVAECEAFFMKVQINDLFFYKDYLTQFFAEKAPLPVKRTKTQQLLIQRIKKQILQYMIQKDYNVDELFAVLKSKSANMNDISQKTFEESLGQRVTTLTNQDIADLFLAIDTDRSNSVSLGEIKAEFADIECAMILKDIREQNKDNLPTLFRTFDPTGTGKIDVIQFAELINCGSKTASKAEVDLLFRVVDKECKGHLTQADLENAFRNIELTLDRNVQGNPKDLFMPLTHKIRHKLGLTAYAIFTKFRNGNNKVTMSELSAIFQQFLSISLSEAERETVEAYLMQYHNTIELGPDQLNQLFMQNWTHRSLGKGSETIVKETATKVKTLLELKVLRIETEIERYQNAIEVSDKEINIRNFKLMMKNISQSIDTFELDNLIHFIDKQHTGFVSTVELLKVFQ